MDFWVKFALSTAVALFGQFVRNPQSAERYRGVLENIYHNIEFTLVSLGSDSPNQPVVNAPVEPHGDLPA